MQLKFMNLQNNLLFKYTFKIKSFASSPFSRIVRLINFEPILPSLLSFCSIVFLVNSEFCQGFAATQRIHLDSVWTDVGGNSRNYLSRLWSACPPGSSWPNQDNYCTWTTFIFAKLSPSPSSNWASWFYYQLLHPAVSLYSKSKIVGLGLEIS